MPYEVQARIVQLQRQGVNLLHIARQLRLSLKTVLRYRDPSLVPEKQRRAWS